MSASKTSRTKPASVAAKKPKKKAKSWDRDAPADKPADEAGTHGQGAPMKRPAQPDEVAPAFGSFASAGDSSYITGEVLTLLGGETTAG